MHTNRPAARQQAWQERLVRARYFVGALLLHLIIFMLVATVVIWKTPEPPPTAEFQAISIKTPPPPPQPLTSGAAANSQFEPDTVAVPVPTMVAPITTMNSNFKIDLPKVPPSSLNQFSDQLAHGAGLTSGTGGTTGGGNAGNVFGSSTSAGNQFTGYLYDLKQTSDGKPTGLDIDHYLAFLAKYVSSGWDDSLLAPYYRTKAPRYTDTFAISTRPSEEAPKAFGVETEVQPGLWFAHYHAKVEAPQAGEYRLAGFADNVMVVKIRGETVFDGGWDSLTNKPLLHKNLPYALPSYVQNPFPGHDPHIKMGPPFRLDVAEPVDMDILIGDCGGVCSFFLLIEAEGNTYETTPDGTPKLPFFQLGSKAAPVFSDTEEHPPYATKPESWQAVGD